MRKADLESSAQLKRAILLGLLRAFPTQPLQAGGNQLHVQLEPLEDNLFFLTLSRRVRWAAQSVRPILCCPISLILVLNLSGR